MPPMIEADQEWPMEWSWQQLTEQAYVETFLYSEQILRDLRDLGLHPEPIQTALYDL